MRYLLAGLLLSLTIAGCGAGGQPTFSVTQTVATFRSDWISLHPVPTPKCPKPLPKKVSASKTEIACSISVMSVTRGAKGSALPLADLLPAGSPVPYFEVAVYRTPGEITALAARGALRPSKDPLTGKAVDYVYRGNVAVACFECSQTTLGILDEVLGHLKPEK
jgi:hypothetical protein